MGLADSHYIAAISGYGQEFDLSPFRIENVAN